MKKASELLVRTCNFVFKAAEAGGICPAGRAEITQRRDYAAQRLHSAGPAWVVKRLNFSRGRDRNCCTTHKPAGEFLEKAVLETVQF